MRRPTSRDAGRRRRFRAGPRAALVLTLLTALVAGGLAHASRLCAVGDHATPQAASTHATHRCAPAPGSGEHAAAPDAGPRPERPTCCADASLAAVTAGKASPAPDRLLGVPLLTRAATSAPVAHLRGRLLAVHGSPPREAGPRLHLEQRVLLL